MPVGDAILFAVFSVVAVVAAMGVVAIRDPVKGAMSLVACFFCIAGLFLLQNAELVAVLEVLVYAGAIMVLFVFVIMLVEKKDEAILGPGLGQRLAFLLKIVAVGAVAMSIWWVAIRPSWGSFNPTALPEGFGSAESIGKAFFSSYLFHFEMTSVLLLAAIVGAVAISRRGSGPGER